MNIVPGADGLAAIVDVYRENYRGRYHGYPVGARLDDLERFDGGVVGSVRITGVVGWW